MNKGNAAVAPTKDDPPSVSSGPPNSDHRQREGADEATRCRRVADMDICTIVASVPNSVDCRPRAQHPSLSATSFRFVGCQIKQTISALGAPSARCHVGRPPRPRTVLPQKSMPAQVMRRPALLLALLAALGGVNGGRVKQALFGSFFGEPRKHTHADSAMADAEQAGSSTSCG